MILPRYYQDDLIAGAYNGWAKGQTNQLLVAPTGSGKTYTFSFIARDFLSQHKRPVIVMAHRDVLLSQISLSLATIGVPHDLICNTKAKRFIGDLHTRKLGKSYYSMGSPVVVTSVDTLVRRDTSNWGANVGLWIMDEAHHVLRDNKWGECVSKFPNALGLGVTATPLRGDGRGLGAHASGVFHNLVETITMAELINIGNLSDYTVAISPLAREVMHQLANVSHKFGEFDSKQAAEVLDKKYITGDVVAQYKRMAMGKRGITFGQNIEHCHHLAEAYNAAGVPAIALSSKTGDKERWQALDDFEAGRYLQLVNCALFDEGFDVPSVVCVSDVSATESYGKFAQRFGRMLRPLAGKPFGIYNDHVGNVLRHKTPDAPRVWSLDDISRKNDTKSEITDTSCLECLRAYEKNLLTCPYCGEPNDLFIIKPDMNPNASVKVVDEQLVEMTREELQSLWGQKSYIDTPSSKVLATQLANGQPRPIAIAISNKHEARYNAQAKLRSVMAEFFHKLEQKGYTVTQARIKFVREFRIDVVTAQTLGEREANTLSERIISYEK